MSDQDLAQEGGGEMPRESTATPGEAPRPFFTTSRPQGEEVRLARVALRDNGYDYDKLSKAQLVELALWAFPALAPGHVRAETKTELVRALKHANVR